MRIVRFAFILMLPGCFGLTQGFDRASLIARLTHDGSASKVTDDDIAEAQAMRPQLEFPCRVAVYLSPAVQWTAQEREIVAGWGNVLKQQGVASDYFIMSSLLTPDATTLGTKSQKEVRLAAARHGADVVLIVHGVHQTETYSNAAGILDLTIVGAFLVPSQHKDVTFNLHGMVIDVSNGFLYAGMESAGKGHSLQPTVTWVDRERKTVPAARLEAIKSFGPELFRRMENLHQAQRQWPALAPRIGAPVPTTAQAQFPED